MANKEKLFFESYYWKIVLKLLCPDTFFKGFSGVFQPVLGQYVFTIYWPITTFLINYRTLKKPIETKKWFQNRLLMRVVTVLLHLQFSCFVSDFVRPNGFLFSN